MTDDEILKNREELQRRLPPDLRTDAANKHVEALMVARRITGIVCREETTAYHSFLSGWDAAMELRYPELLDEHTELHARIMETEINKLQGER